MQTWADQQPNVATRPRSGREAKPWKDRRSAFFVPLTDRTIPRSPDQKLRQKDETRTNSSELTMGGDSPYSQEAQSIIDVVSNVAEGTRGGQFVDMSPVATERAVPDTSSVARDEITTNDNNRLKEANDTINAMIKKEIAEAGIRDRGEQIK